MYFLIIEDERLANFLHEFYRRILVQSFCGERSFRRYRLGGRIKKGGVGEILVPATYVLEHDINGLGAGIDPGS